ncbi:MAG: hypothetical protein ACTSYD_07695 [Candidatus Heimdallarchaeaceae archaeon]
MKVYHVVKKELKEIKPPYEFLNGDVYVIESPPDVWIWLGRKSYVDDKTVGAWAAKVIESKNRDLTIHTVSEGDEPAEFKELIEFTVKEGDTPGFLKHIDIEPDIDYRLLRVFQDESGEIQTEEVEIDIDSFKSNDAYVFDAWDTIYVWIGKDSQIREKYEAGRIARKLDVERKREPLVYTIEEGSEPPNFREFVEKIWRRDIMREMRRKPKKAKKKWWQFWK